MKQKTIYENGEKVLIKSRPTTRMGNFQGYDTFINGKKYFCFTLYVEEAIENSLARWRKERE